MILRVLSARRRRWRATRSWQRVPARPQKTPRRLTKVPEPRKDALQRQRENIDSLRRTVKTILVSGLLISLLGGMLYSEVRQDELTHAYRQLENQMAIAQSENTRLNMELSAKLSLDKVEAYAREKLGMVKNDAPVACINIPQDNEVLLANGKSRMMPLTLGMRRIKIRMPEAPKRNPLPARTKRRKSHPPDRHSRIFWNISFSRAIPMNKAASDSGRSGRSVADRI